MRKFENYFVLFILMLGMILAKSDNENNVIYNNMENMTEYQQFYEELLDLHNEYRTKHNVEELVLDKELSQKAMKIAKNFGIENEPDPNIGINVFYEDYISNLNARNVFFSWYNEEENYTYKDDPEMRSNTSSFTQIVWRSTKQLGVAVFSDQNLVTIVATYSPQGNISDYLTNVVGMKDRMDYSLSN